ncbi:hypothetical protein H5410_041269 [Solanum commersonii]|uniref:CHD3-type chromatin-remodeling factor PICKLE n=1 Tax=Solanum commersonii TaxID=4109 RepID=A0A9J5XR38_SOLCO|nr:hypothetical protein H5410_041269 [Solanum commersonii]
MPHIEIYHGSDWNPHADLQAMARAHRLGQTNKVMIFRLITRGTIEERMMQMTKKKMILEHLVVGRLKAQNINQSDLDPFHQSQCAEGKLYIILVFMQKCVGEIQDTCGLVVNEEELDDIIRYGSKELFADDNDEAGKSRQIYYDDDAIDRLLDREQVIDEDAAANDEEEDSFLKAFKVANFEYVEEAEATAEEEAPTAPLENKATVNNSERASYWEELLRDKYEVHQVEEFKTMGKGKRSRKQMVSVEDDDLAGLEDVSTDGEDDNYEAEADSSDGETASPGAPVVRKAHRKKPRVESAEPLPLMEGEGRSFRVLGFNQSQRAAFVQILMRFGAGEFDWADFTPRLKQKTYEEIQDYGALFLSHISEEITDSPTFSDGVPKEGLRIPDVLVKAFSEMTGGSLFADDIMSRYPGLKGGKHWKDEHDLLLLRALLKHGYGRWQTIVDDKELRIQEIICKELNLPDINLPVHGASQPQVPPAPGPSQELPASGVPQEQFTVPGASQPPHGVNTANAGSVGGQVKVTGDGNTCGAELSHGTSDSSNRQVIQDSSSLYHHFREMQRRQVEFIKKRVLLLEKGLNAEYQKEAFDDEKSHELPNEGMACDTKVVDEPNRNVEEANTEMTDHSPRLVAISPQGISQVACDGKPDRLSVAELYNKMCLVLSGNVQDSFNESHPSTGMRKNIVPLEAICQQMNQILSSPQQNTPNFERKLVQEDRNSEASKSSYPVPSSQVDDRVLNAEKEHDSVLKKPEFGSKSASSCTVGSMTENHNVTPAVLEPRPSSISTGDADIEMVDISTSNA